MSRRARRSAPRATSATWWSPIAGGAPVYLRNVATVIEAPGEAVDYVTHAARSEGGEQAVTMAIAKRPGANATDIAARGAGAGGAGAGAACCLPTCGWTSRANYGETASEKASELILHLLIATLSVTVLIWLFLGWREALVVLVAVPVTLALTLFAYYALGYTLNRITLFALIFSIGILVDDAIVVVENIYRHLQMGDRAPEVAAVDGVDEVGNPTILATFTVIAAILPMAFVSGTDGAVHAADPGGRVGGDAGLARRWRSSSRRTWRSGCCGGTWPRRADARPRARAGGGQPLRAVLRRGS